MATVNIYGMADTWNASGTTYTAIKMDVTDTASAVASLLMDLQVNSTSKFKVDKTGGVTAVGLTIQGNASFNSHILPGSGSYIGWNDDTKLYRDGAANILAQRNGTASQTHNIYDTWTSTTDYHRLAIKTARATLSGVTGASVTATGIIPDGAVVIGVTTKVTTALGAGSGTTGYQVGDGSDPDRWGVASTITLGTTTDNRDWTATTIQAFLAASDVVITAVGGNFDGTGVIYVSVQYLIGQAD